MNHLKNKVSCIVPAYNEEKRIGGVLKILSKHPLISETVVVNDGSKDNTLEEIKKFKALKIISYKKNKGKTAALLEGIKKSSGDILLFIDSDLIGLKEIDITNLILPVVKNDADITISLRQNSLWPFKLLGLDFISGERAFHRSLAGNFHSFNKLSGFEFESHFNKLIIRNKSKIKVVDWKNVSHTRKSAKMGWLKGNLKDMSMVIEIIKILGFFGVFSQIYKMKKLMI